MKKLLLDVTCVNEFFSEAPDYFIVEMTPELISKIVKLSDLAKDNELYSVEYYHFSGEYCSSMTLDNIFTENDIDVTDLTEKMISDANDETSRIEAPIIIVYKDGFRFSAVPKHCSDAELCRTKTVEIKELLNNDTLNALSY